MADREHNSSPMPGVARNPDPALDIAREHEHEHVHHSARAVHHDNSVPVYSAGTTDEKPSKLLEHSAQDSHGHNHLHSSHDIEKNGGFADMEKNGGFADYEEKQTRSSSDPEAEVKVRKWWHPKVLYRNYRLPIHLLIAAFFTG